MRAQIPELDDAVARSGGGQDMFPLGQVDERSRGSSRGSLMSRRKVNNWAGEGDRNSTRTAAGDGFRLRPFSPWAWRMTLTGSWSRPLAPERGQECQPAEDDEKQDDDQRTFATNRSPTATLGLLKPASRGSISEVVDVNVAIATSTREDGCKRKRCSATLSNCKNRSCSLLTGVGRVEKSRLDTARVSDEGSHELLGLYVKDAANLGPGGGHLRRAGVNRPTKKTWQRGKGDKQCASRPATS